MQEWEFDYLNNSKLFEVCSDLLKLNPKFICLSFMESCASDICIMIGRFCWISNIFQIPSFCPSRDKDIWVFQVLLSWCGRNVDRWNVDGCMCAPQILL